MLTTENYPDVSYGPVHIAQPVLVLYIFYIFFVLFVIMSIILAVNYDKFKEIKVETYTKKKQREYDSLMTERVSAYTCAHFADAHIACMQTQTCRTVCSTYSCMHTGTQIHGHTGTQARLATARSIVCRPFSAIACAKANAVARAAIFPRVLRTVCCWIYVVMDASNRID